MQEESCNRCRARFTELCPSVGLAEREFNTELATMRVERFQAWKHPVPSRRSRLTVPTDARGCVLQPLAACLHSSNYEPAELVERTLQR